MRRMSKFSEYVFSILITIFKCHFVVSSEYICDKLLFDICLILRGSLKILIENIDMISQENYSGNLC